MNLAAAVAEWLTDQTDYDRGVALLKETGLTGLVLLVIEKGENSYNRQKLEICLRDWLTYSQTVVQKAEALKTSVSTDQPGPPEQDGETPQEPAPPATAAATQKEIERVIYTLMDQRAHIKAQLQLLANQPGQEDARKQIAYQIKELTRQIDQHYDNIEYLQQYGYLPPAPIQAQTVEAQGMSLSNVRTYVSRYRSKVASAKTDQARATAMAKLSEYEALRDQLEKAAAHAL